MKRIYFSFNLFSQPAKERKEDGRNDALQVQKGARNKSQIKVRLFLIFPVFYDDLGSRVSEFS